jgi:putative endonuclease
MKEWHFYLVRTRHNTLYAGITTDISRRLTEHQGSEKGSKYLRSRRPLSLAYQVKIGSRVMALKTEHQVKKLPKLKKEAIVEKNPEGDALLKLLGLEGATR